MKKRLVQELIKFADSLDRRGLIHLANQTDKILNTFAEQSPKENKKQTVEELGKMINKILTENFEEHEKALAKKVLEDLNFLKDAVSK